MKRRNKQLLVENEYVKELLAVLKENPSPSGKDFAEMVAHVGELESRLAEAVEELKTMRQELQQVQNRSMKAVLQKSCKSLEDNISNMRQKLAELKDHIIEGCQKALSAFKERGTSALDGLSRFFHVKPMLEGIRKAIDNSIRIDDNAVSKIQTLSAEYHQAGRHLKNMGRALVGKEPVAEVKSPGRLSKVIAAPYKADRACMTAAQRSIEKAIDSVTRLQESAERRPSVLRAMQENGENVQPPAKKAVPAVSKAERWVSWQWDCLTPLLTGWMCSFRICGFGVRSPLSGSCLK